MFDDARGGRFKFADQIPRAVQIEQIHERKRDAVQLFGGRQSAARRVAFAVKRGALMRVFAVTQILRFFKSEGQRLRQQSAAQVLGDGRIIRRGVRVGFDRQFLTRFRFGRAVLQFGKYLRVIIGIDDDGDGREIFGSGTNHRRATDVDVFDGFFGRHIGARNRGFKGIQIHAHQVNRRDIVIFQRHQMLRHIAPRQQSAMNRGMQSFDATIHHFGKIRDL